MSECKNPTVGSLTKSAAKVAFRAAAIAFLPAWPYVAAHYAENAGKGPYSSKVILESQIVGGILGGIGSAMYRGLLSPEAMAAGALLASAAIGMVIDGPRATGYLLNKATRAAAEANKKVIQPIANTEIPLNKVVEPFRRLRPKKKPPEQLKNA
jgi:hypothetical protein